MVSCSKGTYIRALCADIGEKLGCGAAMASLVRTRVGSFKIEDAITLSEVEELVASNAYENYVMAPDSIFMEYAGTTVKPEAQSALLNGNKLYPRQLVLDDHVSFKDHDMLRVYSCNGEFKAVYAFVKNEGVFKPFKMFLG